MTEQNTFTPSTKIGKITSVELAKKSASGKTTNHILNGFVLDPITGTEIVIRMVINTEAKRYDPRTRKFIVDDKAPLKGDIYLKGVRKEGSAAARNNTPYPVSELFPNVKKIFTLNKETDTTAQPSNTTKVKKTIEVDDENPF